MRMCKKRIVDGNRRKRRGDAEKDCCVGEVLTCLDHVSLQQIVSSWQTVQTCLNHECQNHDIDSLHCSFFFFPLHLIFFPLYVCFW